MASAFGYDKGDFESDEEVDSLAAAKNKSGQKREVASSSRSRNATQNTQVKDVDLPERLLEMDKLDAPTLERLEWMEPLGYRAISELTGIDPGTLRRHFWASKLKPSSALYGDINYYFNNSQNQVLHYGGANGTRLKRVIELKRFTENNCDYKDPNVRLLWHGTAVANVGGILTNGFRLPMHNGMFGRGVYFADRVTKSLQYCRGGARGNTAVLFLCAVNLGRMHQSGSANSGLMTAPAGFDSVMGCGSHVPDPADVRYHRGAMIPCGRTTGGGRGFGLMHNEFIVYDLAKIAILFLVEIDL